MVSTTPTTTDPTRKAASGGPVSAPAAARFTSLRVRPQRRHLFIVAGLWLAIVGNAEASRHGIGIAAVLLFSAIPSLPLLLGIGQPRARGRVAARIVLPFNLTHEPLVPLAVFALGIAGVVPVVAQDGALIWLGSIVIAWGLGDGLRHADGSVRAGIGRMTSWPRLSSAAPGAAAT